MNNELMRAVVASLISVKKWMTDRPDAPLSYTKDVQAFDDYVRAIVREELAKGP
jgi:hypothetical protein